MSYINKKKKYIFTLKTKSKNDFFSNSIEAKGLSTYNSNLTISFFV